MWALINDILREKCCKATPKSYNEFMERGLQSIIDEVGEIDNRNCRNPYKKSWEKIKTAATQNHGTAMVLHTCGTSRS